MDELRNLHKTLSDLEDRLEQMVTLAIMLRARERGALLHITNYIHERKKIFKVSEFIASAGELAGAKNALAYFEMKNRTFLKRAIIKLFSPFLSWHSKDFTAFIGEFRSVPLPLPTFKEKMSSKDQAKLLHIVIQKPICEGLNDCIKVIQRRTMSNRFLISILSTLDTASKHFVESKCLYNATIRLRAGTWIIEDIKRLKESCRYLRDKITEAIGEQFTVIPGNLEDVKLEDFIGISRLRDHLNLIPSSKQKDKESLLSEILKIKERIDSLENSGQCEQQPS